MKVGDLVRHRDRLPADPPRTGGRSDGWGEIGVVIKLKEDIFKGNCPEPAAEILNQDGDILLIRSEDLEIVGNQLEEEEAMWRIWGDR